jgi:hypothetical protein
MSPAVPDAAPLPKPPSPGEPSPPAKGGSNKTLILVVVACVGVGGCCLLGVLASLLMPVLIKAKQQAAKTDCKNNLRQIAIACEMYAADHRVYPWPRALTGGAPPADLESDAEVRAALALLYRLDYVDDPKLFVCKGSRDVPAAPLESVEERRSRFALAESECSYTCRKKLTTQSLPSRTPVAGDAARGPGEAPNHREGRHVAFKAGDVQFLDEEAIAASSDPRAKQARGELFGWERVGR